MIDAQDYGTFLASLNSALTQQSITQRSDTSDQNQLQQMAIPAYYGQRYARPQRFRVTEKRNHTRACRTPQQ